MPMNLLTGKEVAEILKISVGKLHKMRRENKGPPFFRISDKRYGSTRYDLEDLENWIANRVKYD